MSKKITIKKRSNICTLLLIIGFSAHMQGATLTWIGGNGTWNDPSNWDLGHVPTYEDEVVINSGIVRVESVGEVENIDLNGGTLMVAGALLFQPVGYTNMNSYALDIDDHATFINQGSTTFIDILSGSVDYTGSYFIRVYGSLTNENNGTIYMDGSEFRGISMRGDHAILTNYGRIGMDNIATGILTRGFFYNYGLIDIASTNESFNIFQTHFETTGIINVNNYFYVEESTDVNISGELNISSDVSLPWGFLTEGHTNIYLSGTLNISGQFDEIGLHISRYSEVLNSGEISIDLSSSSSVEIFNKGTFVNNYSGKVSCDNYDGKSNVFEDGVCLNYGTWNFGNEGSNGVVSIEGNITNRNYGKLNIEGKLTLETSSNIVNEGQLNLTSNTTQPHIYGTIRNRGVVNDLYGKLGQIDNGGIIARPVYKKNKIKNALVIGSQAEISVLGWYTAETNNTSAGAYDINTNILSLTKPATKLNSIYVLTMLNSNNVTHRQEVKFIKSIEPIDITEGRSTAEQDTREVGIFTYPNPVTEVINIETRNNFGIESFDARLVRAHGLTIARKTCDGNCQMEIPENLITGIYFLSFEKNGIELQSPEKIKVLH